jgi:NitT/TauT family transport system permease protein
MLPILVLVIGAGYWEKVTYAIADGLIITCLGVCAATYTTNDDLRTLATSYRMPRWSFFWKVFAPGAVLPVIEALRLSMVLVVTAVLLSEMYISDSGMGYVIFNAGQTNDLPLLVGAILVVALLALALNSFFRILERRVEKWLL